MSKKHEAKCRQCGRCCENKLKLGGKVYLTGTYCKWLDLKTKRCTVYANRSTVCPTCLSIPQAIACRILPNDCPYVAGIEDYSTIVPYEETENGSEE